MPRVDWPISDARAHEHASADWRLIDAAIISLCFKDDMPPDSQLI